MSQIVYIIIAILAFGIIVIIHELGHFFIAKLNGIMVEEFSLGMGPKLFGIKGKETQYNVRILPFGGYVKMLGEESEVDSQRSFSSKAPWRKLSVVIAGPLINIITALIIFVTISFATGVVLNSVATFNALSPSREAGVMLDDEILAVNKSKIFTYTDLEIEVQNSQGQKILLTIKRDGAKKDIYVMPVKGYILGFNPAYDDNSKPLPKIATLIDGYPAKENGLLEGDVIVGVDGITISNYDEFSKYMAKNNGESVNLEINRNGAILSFNITPVKSDSYTIGINPKYDDHPSFIEGAKYGINQSISLFKQIIGFFGTLFRGQAHMNEVGGPISLIRVTSAATEQGALPLITIIAFINLNLGIMNLLPFPALDGGQIVIFLYEIISRRKANQKLVESLNYFGYMFLMALMVFMIFKDIFFPIKF
ncbi:MAG: RIP metalloprotease RseP [Oscillospiraceae bacterium]|nr:RIP metalloprotease RseP [Oscillospiraceae bacterium]